MPLRVHTMRFAPRVASVTVRKSEPVVRWEGVMRKLVPAGGQISQALRKAFESGRIEFEHAIGTAQHDRHQRSANRVDLRDGRLPQCNELVRAHRRAGSSALR